MHNIIPALFFGGKIFLEFHDIPRIFYHGKRVSKRRYLRQVNTQVKYFIAIENNKIISSCYLAIIPNLTRNGKSNGFIENVITDEKYRKKGIGKRIIKMAIEYGKQNNCYKIILQSSFKRKENHIFYEKCGFDGDSKRAFEIRF
jgi:GNAT superfamily N-acetyltransferase